MPNVQGDVATAAVHCKLITPEQLAQVRARLGANIGGDAIVKALVAAELLTPWQVKQLAAGKTARFFLSHYKLLGPLGAGGMGQVFRAADLNVARRRVAIKLLPRQAATPTALARFRREGAAALALQHDHIVRCYELGQEGETPFLVMELVEGATLKEYIARHGKLSVQETARIGYEVSLALVHAAEQGIVHRDIKPANILLTRENRVKLTDLGLAKFFGPQGDAQSLATRTGMLLGTLDYLSPEQAEDAKRADLRSDIYSLGCTLYHCLTGGPPFAGTEVQIIMAHREQPPAAIVSRNPEVDNLFADLIERNMLAKRPEERYQTPGEVAAALEPWIGSSSRAFNLLDLLEEAVQQDAATGPKPGARPATLENWETYREYERHPALGPLPVRATLRGRVERAGRAVGLRSLRDRAIAAAAVLAVALVLVGLWRWERRPGNVPIAATPEVAASFDGSSPAGPDAARPAAFKKRDLKAVQWIVLDPAEVRSRGGATMTRLEDKSVLVSGTNPDNDVFTITLNTDLSHITGVRLEVLTDDTLVHRGPGRATNGNFALTGVEVAAGPRGNANQVQPVALADCMASYSQDDQQVRSLLDHRYGSAWATRAFEDGFNIDRFAVFEFDRPVAIAGGATLVVTLRFDSVWKQHSLGRFRLSATSTEKPVRNSGGVVTPAEASRDVAYLTELLYLGKLEEYRRDCASILARLDEGEYDWLVCNNLAWGVALGGGASEVEIALRMVEAALAGQPGEMALLNTYGGVLCQAGRYRDAVRALTSSMEKQQPNSALPGLPAGSAYDWLLLAVAHARLGNSAEARTWFDHGVRYMEWTTQTGSERGVDQAIPVPFGRDLHVLRRLAEKELGIASESAGAVIVGDWKFAHRPNGQPAGAEERIGPSQQPASLRDDSGGRTTGYAAYEGVQPPVYTRYALPGDNRPAGLDGRALDLGPGRGAVHFWNSPKLLRPSRDFSFWMRVRPTNIASGQKQVLAARPGAWSLWITPPGRLQIAVDSLNATLRTPFPNRGPDLTGKGGQWMDLGFSFQGRGDDGDSSDDVLKVYLDGRLVGSFNGDANFTDEHHLHLGMDHWGVSRCACLIDRVICYHGVLDDEGFRRLTGTPPGDSSAPAESGSSQGAPEEGSAASSPSSGAALGDPGNLESYRNRLGRILYFEVTGSTTGEVWGTDIYTVDSRLSVAAVHSGALKPGEKGIVKVTIVPGILAYAGSERNGVTSFDWGGYPCSFRVEPASSAPNHPQWAAADPFNMTRFRGQNGLRLVFELQGRTTGAIFGTGMYTDDSDLRTAVVHAGLLRDGEQGAVIVSFGPGQDVYRGSMRNGVNSQSYGRWSGSIRLEAFK